MRDESERQRASNASLRPSDAEIQETPGGCICKAIIYIRSRNATAHHKNHIPRTLKDITKFT